MSNAPITTGSIPSYQAPQHLGGGIDGAAVGSVALGLAGVAASALPGGGAVAGLATGAASALRSAGSATEFGQLMSLQERSQREFLQFNLLSNMSRMDHEARMNAVRNIRA